MTHAAVFSNDRRRNVKEMNDECGAPAFENIDELLTEKIVNHSRDHSGTTGTSDPSDGAAGPADEPSGPGTAGSRNLAVIAVFILVCLVLYLFFNQKQKE